MSHKSPSMKRPTDDSDGENKVRPSRSPPQRRGRSYSRRRSGSRIVERVIERTSANVAWPMLTRTNYSEWALVMQVNFQTLRIWDVVEIGIDEDADENEYQHEPQAMAGLLRSVPSEMWATLGRKQTIKEAWDAIKVLRIGDDHARDASAQHLRREFGAIVFKEGETVSEFGIRISTLTTNLCVLGDDITDTEVVKKLLQVVPKRLSQAAVSLEMFLDLNKVSIEEVIGRLGVFEERGRPKDITDSMGHLKLCEEDWEARRKARREQESSCGGSSSGSRGKGRGRGRGRGGDRSTPRDGHFGQISGHGGGRPPRSTRCGKVGHWAKDCRGKKKVAAHVTQAEENDRDHALMYITTDQEVFTPPAVKMQRHVHIFEPKVLLHPSQE
jgi:hypothetical protein